MSDKTAKAAEPADEPPRPKPKARLIGHAELVAMADIDEALLSLGDPAAVRRVLDWVDARHYPVQSAPAPTDSNDPRR